MSNNKLAGEMLIGIGSIFKDLGMLKKHSEHPMELKLKINGITLESNCEFMIEEIKNGLEGAKATLEDCLKKLL